MSPPALLSFLIALLKLNVDLSISTHQGQEEEVEALLMSFITKLLKMVPRAPRCIPMHSSFFPNMPPYTLLGT